MVQLLLVASGSHTISSSSITTFLVVVYFSVFILLVAIKTSWSFLIEHCGGRNFKRDSAWCARWSQSGFS